MMARPIPHHRMARWLRSENRLLRSDIEFPYFDGSRRVWREDRDASARGKDVPPLTLILRPGMSKMLRDNHPTEQSPNIYTPPRTGSGQPPATAIRLVPN